MESPPARRAAPVLPTAHLPRSRLLSPLAEPHWKVLVVQAEAGSGKTTLLASHALSLDHPVIWLPLGPRHHDPVVFFREFWGRLDETLGGLPSEPLAIVASLGASGIGRAFSVLCRALPSSPHTLIIDDTQHLPAPETLDQILDLLMTELPPHWRLGLSGRRRLGGALARRQLHGHVLEIGPLELRLTRDELADLAALRGGATEDQLDRLHSETSGWLMGACWGLSGTERSDLAPDVLDDYLAHEVLGRLDPVFQNQLLLTSYLSNLSAESCEKLLGKEARPFLERLRSHGTMLTGLAPPLAYSPCFRDFLRRTSMGRWSRAERRAHFERLARSADDPAEAVSFLLEAEETALAAKAFSQHLERFFLEGRLSTIRSLLAAFPSDWRAASTCCWYAEGEALRREGELSKAVEVLNRAIGLAKTMEEEVAIRLSLAATYGAQGNLDLQVQCARAGLEHARSPGARAFGLNVLGLYHLAVADQAAAREAFNEAMSLFEVAGDVMGQIRVMHNLGLTHAREGDFARTTGYYLEALSIADRERVFPLPLTYNNLSLCHFHLGRYSEGRDVLKQGMSLCARLEARRDLAYMRRTSGHFYLAEGSPAAAKQEFSEAERLAGSLGDRRSQAQALLGMAEVALREQDASGAETALNRALALVERDQDDAIALEAALLRTDLFLLRGLPERALEKAASIAPRVTDPGHRYQRFHLERLRLRAHEALGLSQEAERCQEALQELHVRWGYVLPDRQGPLPEPLIEVESLGKFRASLGGGELPDERWKSDKAKVLLVHLLLYPEGSSKETLLEVLFPEGGARSALPMVVTRLRQALEPDVGRAEGSRYVFHRNGRYVFNPAIGRRLDLLDLRQGLIKARQRGLSRLERRAILEETLQAYRGRFMEDHQDLFWCQMESEKWRRLALEGYEELFSLQCAMDAWPEMQAAADTLLTLEPAAEAAHRARIASLAMQERTLEALHAFDIAQQSLRQFVALELDEGTLQLAESIRSGHVSVRQVRESFASRWH